MRLKFLCVRTKAVILLEIDMVSPGTHRVKNHESLSIKPNDSQFKKTRSPQLKMQEPLCNRKVNLKTGAKTLYYSLLTLNIVLLYI